MKKFFKVFLIILVILLLGAAAAYFFLNPKKALKIILPEVDEISMVHVKLKRDTALIKLDMKIENNSFLKLNMDSIFYQVEMDSTLMLKREQYLGIVLNPGDQDTVKFPLALPIKTLQGKIKSLQGTDSVDINIRVRVVYATIFGKTVLPYEKVLRIAVPKPPRIELVKTEFIKRDKKTFYVNAHVKVINEGKLDLKISDIHFLVVVKDLFTVKDKYGKKIVVEPGSHHTFVMPLKIEFDRMLKTAFMVLTDNDKVPYTLKATALVESGNIEGEQTPIEIEKSGIMELKK